MPDKTKKSRTRSEKKIGRIRIGFNVLVQIVLILFVVAMVNSFAFKHYARWDFSGIKNMRSQIKRSVSLIRSRQMRITVFFAPNTPITGDVQNLLTEYQYAGKERWTSSISILSGIFPAPKSCSTNTRLSQTRAFWCSITMVATNS